MSQIICLRKNTCSKRRQNCFGNWIEHCLHLLTYHSNDVTQHVTEWEILDEEGTLVKSVCQKVTFHHSGCTIAISILEKANGKRRSFLEWKNSRLSLWSAENKSWPKRLHWYVEDFLTAWMSLTLSGQWLRLHARHSAPSHRTKVTQQFLWHNTPDYIAADEWASYYPYLNPLDYCIWDILQDLVYEGRWLAFASLQDLKEAIKNKWKEVTIQIVRKSTAHWKTTECG